MAGAGENIEKQLTDKTACPVCKSAFSDPRALPCTHIFCFHCLKRTFEEEQKKLEDTMPCPQCREVFTIPEDGITGLQKASFMENLESPTIICDMCNVRMEVKTDQIPAATMTCLECEENYCDSCADVHKFLKLSKYHQMVKVGSDTKLGMKQPFTTNCCSKHTEKTLDYYCTDCKKVVCMSCFVENHASHRCKDVTTVEVELRQTIKRNSVKISMYTRETLSLRKNADINQEDFLKEMVDQEKAIRKRNQELKDIIDKHTQSLLDELSVNKARNMQEMEAGMKEIDRHCTALRRFEANLTELMSYGSAGDICSSFNELNVRTDELVTGHKALIGLHSNLSKRPKRADIEVVQTFNSNVIRDIQGDIIQTNFTD